MATLEARRAAAKRRKENKIDFVSFEVKKGMSVKYTEWAAMLGIGKMEMIRRAIEEFVQNHGGEGVQENTPVKPAPMGTVLTAEQRKILDTIESLPPDARRALMKFLHALQAEHVDEKPPVD